MSEFVTEPGDEGFAEPDAQTATIEPQDEQVEAVEEPAEQQADENVLLAALVAERTDDLKRLQAEYVNYKKRVDRDRTLARDKGVESVVLELLPVLDAVSAAEQHEEMGDGLKLIAAELTRIATRFGLAAFGEAGEEFDPRLHEALMQMPVPGASEMTLAQVIQRGYTLNGSVIRPARVAVAVPADEASE